MRRAPHPCHPVVLCVQVGFMVDNRIHVWEAIVLLMLYFGYCTVMYFNEDLEKWVQNRVDLTKQPRKPWQVALARPRPLA